MSKVTEALQEDIWWLLLSVTSLVWAVHGVLPLWFGWPHGEML